MSADRDRASVPAEPLRHGGGPSVWSRLRRSVGARGLAGTVKMAVRWQLWNLAPGPYKRLQAWRVRRDEQRFRMLYGVDTANMSGVAVADAPDSSRAGGQVYEATGSGLFRSIVRSSGVRPADYTFVDIGCGKGRMLILAAAHGFANVIGVEHSPSLAAQATANLDRVLSLQGEVPPMACLLDDATTFALPPGRLFLYLFNPFNAALMQRFVDHLGRSLAARPQQVVIAYLNPRHAEILEAVPFLRRDGIVETLHLEGTCNLYHSVGEPPDMAA